MLPGRGDRAAGPGPPVSPGGCALATGERTDFVHLFTNDVS